MKEDVDKTLTKLIKADIERNEKALQAEQRTHSVHYRIDRIFPVTRASDGARLRYEYTLVFRYPHEEESEEKRSGTLVVPSLEGLLT